MSNNDQISANDKKDIEHLNSLGTGFEYMAEMARDKMNPYKDSAMSEEEYQSKKEEVIGRFRKEFFTNYYTYNPKFHAIVQLLIRGEDPYLIIEQIIELLKKEEDLNIKLLMEGIRLPQPTQF